VSRAYRVPEVQMPTTKQQRRRALELLEASIDGCTEAIMLAYGFKTELLVELVPGAVLIGVPCVFDIFPMRGSSV